MARSKPKATHEKSVVVAGCVHYWVIEDPKGPTSRGICKFCGAESEFNNYFPYPPWQDGSVKPSKPHMSDTELN